jgi:hypothetical protein
MPQDLSKFPIERQKAYYLNFLTWLLPKSFWLEKLPDHKDDIEEIIPYGNSKGYSYYEKYKDEPNIDVLLSQKIKLLHSVLKPKHDFDWQVFIIDNYFARRNRSQDMIKDAYNFEGIEYYKLKNAYKLDFDLPKDLPLHSKLLPGRDKLDYVTVEQAMFYNIAISLGKAICLKQILYDNFAHHFFLSIYGDATQFHTLITYYSKTLILQLYSFLECFVNSCAFDYTIKNNININNPLRMELGGRNNKRGYHSIDYKLKHFPQIISNNIIDIEQWKKEKSHHKEYLYPERSMYDNLRDSQVHLHLDIHINSEKLFYNNPIEWLEDGYEYYKLIIDTVKLFWNNCYPDIELTYLKMNDDNIADMIVRIINYELSLGVSDIDQKKYEQLGFYSDKIKEKIRNVILCKEEP